MISRNDTINISNMPIASEEPYTPQLQLDKDEWLSDLLTGLLHPSEWKITKFETTPPVRFSRCSNLATDSKVPSRLAFNKKIPSAGRQTHFLTHTRTHYLSLICIAAPTLVFTIALNTQIPVQCNFQKDSDGEAGVWCIPLGVVSGAQWLFVILGAFR